MREVDLLYLIDQKVVFGRDGEIGNIAAGSLGMSFDRMEHIKVNDILVTRILQHFDIDWMKIKVGNERQSLYATLQDENNNSLFYIDYQEHSKQVSKIEAEIGNYGILNVKVTYKGAGEDDKDERWTDEFSYSGKYEVWWKRIDNKEAP